MSATDELRGEHEPIMVMLGILESVAARADRGQKLSGSDLADVVEFLRVFADRCHHSKEELALIPAMVEAGVPREGGIIAAVLAEHEDARECVRGLAQSLEGLRAGDLRARSGIASNARKYAALLRDHIDRENGTLYPTADQHLRPEQQSLLISAFDRIEEERVGHGKHEELHDMLYELRESYLTAGAGAAMR